MRTLTNDERKLLGIGFLVAVESVSNALIDGSLKKGLDAQESVLRLLARLVLDAETRPAGERDIQVTEGLIIPLEDILGKWEEWDAEGDYVTYFRNHTEAALCEECLFEQDCPVPQSHHPHMDKTMLDKLTQARLFNCN